MAGDMRSNEELVAILWSRGVKLLNDKHPEEALKYLLHVGVREPENTECLNKIGIAYAELKDFDKAEAFFERAVQINPKFAQGHSNIGNVYFGRGEYDRAIAKYKIALGINPSYHIAQRNMAAALRKTGRIAEAIRQLKSSDRTHRDVQLEKLKEKDQEQKEKRPKQRRLGCLTLLITMMVAIAVIMMVVG